ncbi:helix-turn-helix domain-containing protein [Brevundimonas balnearis]|uniref:Helix-turn-helix domain-containing protein n=1 Tax=Brevundimonas balnearis TaxID=1572858 RepID=A0ABV6QZ44_9CAUL
MKILGFPASDPEAARVGARLKTWRTRRELSLDDLAKGTGLTIEQLRRAEAGRERLSAEALTAVSRKLGLPRWALMSDTSAT